MMPLAVSEEEEPKAPLDEQRIEAWIRQLGSDDAAKADRAHAVLVELITNPESDVRARDAHAFISRNYELRGAIQKFMGALGDAPAPISKRLVLVLGDIARKGGYLGDSRLYANEVMDRQEMAKRIAGFGPDMIEPLVEIVRFGGGNEDENGDYDNETLGYVAALALARLGNASMEPLLGVLTGKTSASLHLKSASRIEGKALAALALGRMPAAHARALPLMVKFLCTREARHLRGAPRSSWRFPSRRHEAFVGTGDVGVRALVAALGRKALEPFAVIELLLALRAMGTEALAAVPAVEVIASSDSSSEVVRQIALRTIGQIRAPDGVAVLIRALLDEKNESRYEARWELGKVGIPAIPALSRLLTAENQTHRNAAIELLAKYGVVAYAMTPRLLAMIKDDNSRGFIVMSLAQIHEWSVEVPPVVVDQAVRLLGEQEDGLREWGIAALAELGTSAAAGADALRKVASHDASADLRRAAVLALAAVAPKRLATTDLAHLIDELREDMAWRRERAKDAIARLPPDLARALVPPLAKGLTAWRALPLNDVMRVLGNVGPAASEAIPALERIAKAPPRESGVLRSRALSTLWKVRPDGVERAVRIIEASLDKGRQFDEYLQIGIANPLETLAEIGPRARVAVPVLLRVLAEAGEHGGLRRGKAAEALGAIGHDPARTVPLLVSLLTDREMWVRDGAVKGLGRFGNSAQAAVPHLVKLLEDPSQYVRGNAVEALDKIGAAGAVDALVKALEDQEDVVRFQAAETLGRLGSKAAPAVPALRAVLGAGTWREQIEAFIALWSILGKPPTVPGQETWK